MAAMIPLGKPEFASDPTTAALILKNGSQAQAAVDGRVSAVAEGIIAADGTVTQAAAAAAAAAVDARLDADLDDRYVNERTLDRPAEAYAVPFLSVNGRVLGGIREDGTFHFLKLENQIAPPSGGGAEGETVSNRARVGLIGDSLTEGFPEGAGGVGDVWPDGDTIRYHLAGLDQGATVLNGGHSGQTVDEAAIRVGALPLTVQSAVTVPVSGAVTVTVQAGIGWRPTRSWDFHGRLGTVPGTLHRTNSETTSLTFEADAGALTVPAEVAVGDRFVGDEDQVDWDVVIIGLGRNDVSYNVVGSDSTVAAHVIAGTQRLIDWLKPQRKRFLLWGTTNSTNEGAGSAGHTAVSAINSWAAAAHPNHFVDVRSWLVNEAIYDLGLTPTSGDLAAIAADRPPASVMIDTVHWTKPVAQKVAGIFAMELTRRDWKA